MDSLIGYLIALTLSLVGLAGFSKFADIGVQNVKTASAASSFRLINTAAERYIRDNSPTLIQGPGAQPGVQTVTFAQLEAGGYIPGGVAAQNLFRQNWEVRVIEPVENRLQAIVVGVPVAGAPQIPVAQLTNIAATTGFSGGYTPYPNMLGDTSAQPNIARGGFGAWQIAFGNAVGQFGPVPAAGGGALVGLLAVNGGGASGGDQFLSRRADPANPELNAMQTNLSMTDEGGTRNSITGAEQVEANSLVGNRSLSIGGGAVAVGTGLPAGGPCDPNLAVKIGDSALQANCAGTLTARMGAGGNGTMDLRGNLTASGAATVAGLSTLAGGAVVGSAGQPNFLRLVNSNAAVDGQPCSVPGAMTANAQGAILHCRAGEGAGTVWSLVGLPIAANNGACSTQGGIGRDNAGNALICHAGRYIPMQARLGGLVEVSTAFHQSVEGGTSAVISKPNCPPGATPRIFLQYGRARTGNETGFVQLYAQDNGTSWRAFLVDGQNVGLDGDYISHIYCQFN